MVQKIRDLRSSVSVKIRPRKDFMSEDENKTVVHKITNDNNIGFGVGKLRAMSLSHNRERESLFDCEEEEELKVGLKYKEKAISSWDNHIIQVNFERKSKILDGYVQQLVDSHDLHATKKIKEMIIEDSKLAAGLKPLVFERLVDILQVENINESTKESAACILAFAIDKSSADIKKKATEVLVKLMSDDRDTISIPVLRTLTRLAYFSAYDASFIIENGALQGALDVFQPIYPNLKIVQNLAKFLVVVVRQVQVPKDKVGAVVIILDTILKVRRCNLRCIMRACYTLSFIEVEWWVNERSIVKNIINLSWHWNDMVAYSALRVAANIVKSKNYRKILTKNYKFLQCLGWSEICCRPKKYQMEACHIISNMAANGGTSIKDLYKSNVMAALFELLEVDDFDVRMAAACAIHNVIRCHRCELASMTIDVVT